MKRDRGKPDKLAVPLAVARLLQRTGALIEAAEAVRDVRDDLLVILRETPVDAFDTKGGQAHV